MSESDMMKLVRMLEEADWRRLNQERARRDEEFESRRDTGEP